MKTRSCVIKSCSQGIPMLWKKKSLYGFTSFSDPMHTGMAQFWSNYPCSFHNTKESSSTSSRSNSLFKLLYRPSWTCVSITQSTCWSIGRTMSTTFLKLGPPFCECLAMCAVAMSHTEKSYIKLLTSSRSNCLKKFARENFPCSAKIRSRIINCICSDCNKKKIELQLLWL